MTEEQYIQKGFNAGYELQQQSPALAQTIKEGFADKSHPYAQGFSAGTEESINEKVNSPSSYRERQIQKAKDSKSKGNNNSKDKDDKGIEL